MIDFNSSIDYLGKVIAEQIDNIPCFSQLKGLKAVNIQKFGQEKYTFIPNDDLVKYNFHNGDSLMFDLITQEYWLICNFIITTDLNKAKTSLQCQIKIPINLRIKKLRLMLIQFCIIFFCENIEQINEFHFALNKTRIKLTDNVLKETYKDRYLEDRIFENCMYIILFILLIV